jgi:diacylglycerol O-acyltransferase/trehalose O-mycolyltransferase
MYVDWFNGAWRYESFIIDQLLPWVDLHLRTIPRRESRSVAGLSMGGYGAMYLAARHPDLFSSEGSFSGIVDLLRPAVESSAFDETLIAASQGGGPGQIYGNLLTNAIVWHDHNPGDLGVNLLRNVAPFLEYGDPPADQTEATANLENKAMTSELQAVGINPTVVTLPMQGHNYTVWNDGLKNFLPIAEDEWQDNLPAPDGFSYTSAANSFSAYNYTVQLTRPVAEFATLSDVTGEWFSLTGSGTATITTAARYVPGGRYLVRLPAGPVVLVADKLGRLTIHVALGPSASADQFSPTDAGTRPAETVRISIGALATRSSTRAATVRRHQRSF